MHVRFTWFDVFSVEIAVQYVVPLQDMMEPDMHATPLATSIDPVQFQSIKHVYGTLISADWFYDTEETRQDLADLIMRQYRMGHVGADELLSACEAGARERYSKRAAD
ncbi:hypothetical protein IHQ71_30770 (plasmid) [Rhizobium sp. TH2]|uniref:hypothetical protein n=1 Tax=Rhizobium sp. TH2 TaxID=2775403 RepID=UPI0021584BE0|nr:hypothetical protein [Rhizobium sp. TH2]UVC12389.1 hypothetical protein IHQ71_30770 [Rhizobium sp. TH2]